MIDHRIRRGVSDSVYSTDQDNHVDVKLEQTTKLLPYGDVVETLSQKTVFEDERSKCTKYRLITTVAPFCSNILFNTMTEMVKDEGSDTTDVINDDEKKVNMPSARGMRNNVTRVHMLRNTEYSNGENGYVYQPGYDIFNNHIIRNKSFKVVNKEAASGEEAFNTIEDLVRTFDSQDIMLSKRNSVTDITEVKQHLYNDDDLLSFVDSINSNLREENGWFGFVNTANIPSVNVTNSEPLNIGRVLNNRNAGEFIDMYPDRTLYSFAPKYNVHRNRPEYNWHVCVTYPYVSVDNHPLVKYGNVNALPVFDYEYKSGYFSDKLMMFRMFTKHGLRRGDKVYIYVRIGSENDGSTNEYRRLSTSYNVDNVGNLDGSGTEYFFSISTANILYDIAETLEVTDFNLDGTRAENDAMIKALLDGLSFRVSRCVSNRECRYYFRKHRKVPNFRFKRYNLDDEVLSTVGMEQYIDDNATKNGKLCDFTREQYKLAFASTIYGDSVAQMTFTDTIDIEGLTDNLGRPLTELYFTVIKNNAGHEQWYDSSDKGDANIEYSHCFGKLTSGVEMYHSKDDTFDERVRRATYSDVRMLNNLGCFLSMSIGQHVSSDEDIKFSDNEFIGDLVEFSPSEATERVIADVEYRFNTSQRELTVNASSPSRAIHWQEIANDDYSSENFSCQEYSTESDPYKHDIGGQRLEAFQRPEGYFYKPHYRIQVREFGELKQDSNIDIRVMSAKPVQSHGVSIQLNCGLAPDVSAGDVILVHDDAKGTEYRTTVTYVINRYQFMIAPLKDIGWIKFCDIMNSETENKRFKIRKLNKDIPNYAHKIGNNKYLWRNVRNSGDLANAELEEYPFANGHFYVTNNINFFVKRQDPHGSNGLRSSDVFPNDVYGNIKVESNYIYEDKTIAQC